MANSPSGESVVARLARIVAAFDHDHEFLNLTSVAQRTGLPLSTARRLVVDLLAHGFLEGTPDGPLRAGPLIRQHGAPGPAEAFMPLRNAAVPLMESVHAVLKAHFALAVLDHDETLYLEPVSRRSTATNLSRPSPEILFSSRRL